VAAVLAHMPTVTAAALVEDSKADSAAAVESPAEHRTHTVFVAGTEAALKAPPCVRCTATVLGHPGTSVAAGHGVDSAAPPSSLL